MICSNLLDTNVLTLRKAIHYAPTDIPTVFLGSHAKKPFELIFEGDKNTVGNF